MSYNYEDFGPDEPASLIDGQLCYVCDQPAIGFNVKGHFCKEHQPMMVRDWNKEKFSFETLRSLYRAANKLP